MGMNIRWKEILKLNTMCKLVNQHLIIFIFCILKEVIFKIKNINKFSPYKLYQSTPTIVKIRKRLNYISNLLINNNLWFIVLTTSILVLAHYIIINFSTELSPDDQRYYLSAIIQTYATLFSIIIIVTLFFSEMSSRRYGHLVTKNRIKKSYFWPLYLLYILIILLAGYTLISPEDEEVGINKTENIKSIIYLGAFILSLSVIYFWKLLETFFNPQIIIKSELNQIDTESWITIVETLKLNNNDTNLTRSSLLYDDPLLPSINLTSNAIQMNDFPTSVQGFNVLINGYKSALYHNLCEPASNYLLYQINELLAISEANDNYNAIIQIIEALESLANNTITSRWIESDKETAMIYKNNSKYLTGLTLGYQMNFDTAANKFINAFTAISSKYILEKNIAISRKVIDAVVNYLFTSIRERSFSTPWYHLEKIIDTTNSINFLPSYAIKKWIENIVNLMKKEGDVFSNQNFLMFALNVYDIEQIIRKYNFQEDPQKIIPFNEIYTLLLQFGIICVENEWDDTSETIFSVLLELAYWLEERNSGLYHYPISIIGNTGLKLSTEGEISILNENNITKEMSYWILKILIKIRRDKFSEISKIFALRYIKMIEKNLDIIIYSNDDIININTAPEEELKLLQGIGKVKANRIIENRPYQSIDELVGVEGISNALLFTFRNKITI